MIVNDVCGVCVYVCQLANLMCKIICIDYQLKKYFLDLQDTLNPFHDTNLVYLLNKS